MTGATTVDPVEVLRLRAWARAYLVSIGELGNLVEAIEPLQPYAEQFGLVVTGAQAVLVGRQHD